MASSCHECGGQIIFVRVGKVTIPCSVPADAKGPIAARKRAFSWTGWFVTAERPAAGAARYVPHAKTCKSKPRRTVADHRRQEVAAPALPISLDPVEV